MKKTLMAMIFIGVMGYGAQCMPWYYHPIIFSMPIADASEDKVAVPVDKRVLPPSSSVNEKANASAVADHEAVQEAVQKALETRQEVLETKRLELQQAMTPAERKVAVQKAREALHDVQDALHDAIASADHDPEKPEQPEVSFNDPRPIAHLDNPGTVPDDDIHSVTNAIHQALDTADKTIEKDELKNYGTNDIHPVIRVMKREVHHMKEGLDVSLKTHADASKESDLASDIKAAIQTANAGIQTSQAEMRSAIAQAVSRDERRKAIEAFMTDTRSIVEKLRLDLEAVPRK